MLARAAGDSFQVGQSAQLGLQLAARERIVGQHGHPAEPLFERPTRAQRLIEPAPELSRAHRGRRLANDQAGEVVAGRRSVSPKAETAPGGRIEMHEGPWMLGVEPEQTGLEVKPRPIRVSQQRVGGGQGFGPLIATEGGQRFDAEQRLQPVDRGARIEVLRLDPAGWRAPRQREQSRPVHF